MAYSQILKSVLCNLSARPSLGRDTAPVTGRTHRLHSEGESDSGPCWDRDQLVLSTPRSCFRSRLGGKEACSLLHPLSGVIQG